MASTKEYAALSLYVYEVANAADNRPELPGTGWTELRAPESDAFGFCYGVFRNEATEEVVVAYTGTDPKQILDWINDFVAGVGTVPAPQITAAAEAYLKAKIDYCNGESDKITLTGHSLGGGLASVMATWFDVPAVVFDVAPFENTAKSLSAWLQVRGALAASGYSDPAWDRAIIDYSIRKQNVNHHYIEGEALEPLRVDLPRLFRAIHNWRTARLVAG